MWRDNHPSAFLAGGTARGGVLPWCRTRYDGTTSARRMTVARTAPKIHPGLVHVARQTPSAFLAGGTARGGVLPWCRTRYDGTDLGAPYDRRTNWSQEACAGGRCEGDTLLHVLPKSRGQEYRVRSTVRARLASALEAPL